jgi:hypothetical protein
MYSSDEKDTMTQNIKKKETKQRLTAFVDPALVRRAKVRGALEGLTISEVVEKALDVYAPKIEEGSGQNLRLKFISPPVVQTLIPKHTKVFSVPR